MEPLKVIQVISDNLRFEVLDDRRYRLLKDSLITIRTDSGYIQMYLKAGFLSDGRSGGVLVDWLIPNMGSQSYRPCPIFHDGGFAHASACLLSSQEPVLSFETMNSIFEQMLVLPKKMGGAGLAEWRAKLAYAGVSTGFGREAYENVDKIDRKNVGMVRIEWRPRLMSYYK